MKLEKIIDIAVNTLNDKKALNISAIEIGELTMVAEYFIIATATSSTHVRALAEAVEDNLSKVGIEPDHIEGRATGWILLDYSGVVVHVFTAQTREYYNLDKMWDDGKKINLDDILTSAREED